MPATHPSLPQVRPGLGPSPAAPACRFDLLTESRGRQTRDQCRDVLPARPLLFLAVCATPVSPSNEATQQPCPNLSTRWGKFFFVLSSDRRRHNLKKNLSLTVTRWLLLFTIAPSTHNTHINTHTHTHTHTHTRAQRLHICLTSTHPYYFCKCRAHIRDASHAICRMLFRGTWTF